MIKKTAIEDKNLFIYEFTEGNIYDYVRCYIESAEQLALLNLLIQVYEDENKKNAVKLLMKEQRNVDIIFDRIEKMKNNKSVVYTVSYMDDDTMYPHINSLFLNQNDCV